MRKFGTNSVPKALHARSSSPCRRQRKVDRPNEAERPRKLSGARILVVEDEVFIALDLQATLTDAGAEVIGPSFTLEQAFTLASRENLSAAILDVRLGRD